MASVVLNDQKINHQGLEDSKGLKFTKSFFKESPKDVFKAIRIPFEWINMAVKDSGINNQISNLTKAIKGGEDTLSIVDLGGSALKFTSGVMNGSISEIRVAILKGIWDAQKLTKLLVKSNVFNIGSKILVPFSGIGGVSFALFAGEGALQQISESIKLDPKTKNFDQKTKFRVFRLAQYIGMMALGIILALSSFFGIITPFIISQLIGTALLISTIYSKVLEYSLKKEEEKQELKSIKK